MKDTPRVPDASKTSDQLSRETFFADLATTLVGTLEETVGLEDAACFVAQVGDAMGRSIGASYDVDALAGDPIAIGEILCDLKAKIGGNFKVVSATENELRFSSSSCPFGARVHGKPSLCMMTTNVFGRIAANAAGYAAVEIDEALALGHAQCSVTVFLKPVGRDDIHEFFKDPVRSRALAAD